MICVLYGTTNSDSIIPVAIFSTEEKLSQYVNDLSPFGVLNVGRKNKSLLANYDDSQTKTIEQIWDTCDDWKHQLDLAKQCVRDPI
ncbi:MAG: hypothetical protein WC341_18025 [Bacteroidales bacterium]|jgi:hypothetical protein